MSNKKPRLCIVMGVSGSGKSTIAEMLAKELGGRFLDADDYHPKTNIDKMREGTPLEDKDRWSWLELFAKTMAEQMDKIVIGACSSLTKAYRDFLIKSAREPILFIYLDGSRELLLERISSRKGHFMPVSQLDNQLETLEKPDSSENAMLVDISGSPQEIFLKLTKKLKLL